MAAELADVLQPIRHVLLDFDGPVCSVFAGLPAPEVAHRLRMALLAAGEPVPAEVEQESDPLAVLRSIADVRPDAAPLADVELTRLETEAVQTAQPNPEGAALLQACARSGRGVSVVSNNAGSAIKAYLSAHGLDGYVVAVFGRTPGDPSSMKPSPQLLLEAMNAAAVKPGECIFIGDAARDVEAGHAAGVQTIGYANKPGKEAKLTAAGAVVVVDSMGFLAESLT